MIAVPLTAISAVRTADTRENRVSVIRSLLQDPTILFFGRLLAEPSVQSLCSTVDAPLLHAIKWITFGNPGDPVGRNPVVTPLMQRKAQLVQLLQILARRPTATPYHVIKESLHLAADTDVEDLVLEAMTNELVDGRLNPIAREVVAWRVASSDVPLGEISSVRERLEQWLQRVSAAPSFNANPTPQNPQKEAVA